MGYKRSSFTPIRFSCFLITLLHFVFACEVGIAAEPAEKSTEPGAKGVVEKLHGTLIDAMKNADRLGYMGRYDLLAPVIEEGFDLPYIARIVLGRQHWKSLDRGQRSTMLETFSRLAVATYAGRFDGYSGERFEVISERPLKRGRILVRSELRESDGNVVRLDYVLHQADSQWRIVNVIADGVSDLSLKRADYSAIMKDEGFDALIARMQEQIVEYARG